VIDRDRIRKTTLKDIARQKIEDDHPQPKDLGPVRVVDPRKSNAAQVLTVRKAI